MSDLINRQDAIDAIYYHFPTMIKTVREAAIVLEEVPSAEPEIIHCKDCKYMTEHYDTDENAPYWTCSEWVADTDYDGFCHYAERRKDNE